MLSIFYESALITLYIVLLTTLVIPALSTIFYFISRYKLTISIPQKESFMAYELIFLCIDHCALKNQNHIYKIH